MSTIAPNPYIVGRSGRRRPMRFWLVAVSGKGTKTHALLESGERTICGREVNCELSDEKIPGTAPEPNCRVCRRAVRVLARSLNPNAHAQRSERMLCPRCLSGDLELALREVTVDRCAVLRRADGGLTYDVDDDPKRRVEERRLKCRSCGARLVEKQLVSSREARRQGDAAFDVEAFRVRHAAASQRASEKLAATVERLSRPVVDDSPF